MEGRVIAAHGRQYVVEMADGKRLPCFPRGKKSEIACGDRVDIQQTSDDQGVIDAIQPRSSLLYRSNEIRQKLIAANVDQLVIVVATEPAFSDELIARALIAAESEEIAPLIVLNKCDLADKLPAARARLATLTALGYRVLELSALEHAEDLRPYLAHQTSPAWANRRWSMRSSPRLEPPPAKFRRPSTPASTRPPTPPSTTSTSTAI